MLTVQAYIDKVWDVDLKNWTRGDALYLQAKGAARAWVCRDCTVKSIVVFPDNGQALDLSLIHILYNRHVIRLMKTSWSF